MYKLTSIIFLLSISLTNIYAQDNLPPAGKLQDSEKQLQTLKAQEAKIAALEQQNRILLDNINKINERMAAWEQQKKRKVGFVSLKQIFRDYKKVADMEQQINREAEADFVAIKELEQEVKQLREEMPRYRPDKLPRQKKEKELADKLTAIKVRRANARTFFEDRMLEGIKTIYREIVQEVEQYAKANEFALIVRVANADFSAVATPDELRLEINTRDVLYWEEKDDLTGVILQQLNQKYKEGKIPKTDEKSEKRETY